MNFEKSPSDKENFKCKHFCMWYVYIAEFKNNKLYTGITTDPERRIKEHNLGLGAKSLKGKGPVNLVYLENHPNQTTAAQREAKIKKWTKERKIKLILKYTNKK